jgi:hypothetical protein
VVAMSVGAGMSASGFATPNLEELKELNRQLTMLLEDPQPGLVMWQMALYRVIEKIAEFSK